MSNYQKLNQVIAITGANGKTIDVLFAWIRNNDGVVRLVSGIPSSSPSEGTSASPSAEGAGKGEGGERSFFTSSFFRGLLIGVAVTLAVVAVVATGGAALAVIAPGVSAAIASSAAVSAVGTGLAYAGGALLIANTVQSVRQRDLTNNPISEEQANFNLGFGVGSVAGGALAKPFAGAGNALGQSLGRGANSAAQGLENLAGSGGNLALAGGGAWGNAVAAAPAVVAGVSTTGAITVAGAAMGPSVLMMSGTPKDAQKLVRGGRGPRDVERIDKPEQSVPGSQWHAHQKQVVNGKNPALNLDGSSHDGTPSFSKKTLEWLKSFGWSIP